MRLAVVLLSVLLHVATRVADVSATCATHPVDCQVVYGQWSDCDPCTYTQSRHINITTPAQSGGVPCPSDFTEVKSCTTTNICTQSNTCGPSMFQCQTGRCISSILKCNGEDDCGDNSDEINCTNSQQFSRSIQECMALKPIPYLDLIGSGYNYLTGEMKGRVLDNDRFDGYCRKAQDGDTGTVYRLPYNVDTFHFQVEADGQSHSSVYDSLANFTNAMENDDNEGWSLGIGFKYGKLASFNMATGQSQSKTYKQIHQLTSLGASKIFQVGTSVENAQFYMNKHMLILDPFFYQKINELPSTPNAKVYFDFIEQYGTHYLTGGSLGGTYEFINVFYQTNNSALWGNETAVQTGFNFQFNLDVFGVNADTMVKNQDNNTGLLKDLHQKNNTKTEKVVVVRGGTSQAAGELTLSLNTTQIAGAGNKYSIWVNSLKQNPAIISKKLTPICDLIYFSNVIDAKVKWEICLESLGVYLSHYSTSGCNMTCTNGGVLINIEKTCYCACAAGFTGQQCATKLLSPLEADQAFSETANLLKFITTTQANGVPTTTDPVPLVTKTVGSFDQILKGKGNIQFFISSDTGKRYQNSGNFSLNQVDDLLMNEIVRPLNLNQINCNNLVCEVVDFDLDSQSNVVLSMKQTDLTKNPAQISGNIYQLKSNGAIGYTISNPCNIAGSLYPYSYVTVDCQDELIVGCYASPATLRLYNSDGLPDQVIQFADLGAINSLAVSEVDGSLWLHTVTGQLVSYDMNTWQRTFYMQGPFNSTDYSDYCQISIDFMGNVIVAQAQSGTASPKFIIVDTSVQKAVVAAYLTDKDDCKWLSSYRGRVYLLCSDAQQSSIKTISVYDYLK